MVDKDLARPNIERFRKLLATNLDAVNRRTILGLLAEEEAKLAALDDPPAAKQLTGFMTTPCKTDGASR